MTAPLPPVRVTCATCSTEWEMPAARYRTLRRQSRSGNLFCSHSCSARGQRRRGGPRLPPEISAAKIRAFSAMTEAELAAYCDRRRLESLLPIRLLADLAPVP